MPSYSHTRIRAQHPCAARSMRTNAFAGRASVSYRRCEKEVHIAARPGERGRVSRGGMKGGERSAARGERWVSHSLSMRVGLATRTPRRGNRLQLSEHAWPNVGVRNTSDGAFELLQRSVSLCFLPRLSFLPGLPAAYTSGASLSLACKRWAGLTVH